MIDLYFSQGRAARVTSPCIYLRVAQRDTPVSPGTLLVSFGKNTIPQRHPATPLLSAVPRCVADVLRCRSLVREGETEAREARDGETDTRETDTRGTPPAGERRGSSSCGAGGTGRSWRGGETGTGRGTAPAG